MPQPLYAYFGHHKCGTTWIASICRDVCAELDLHFAEVHNAGLFDHDLASYVEHENVDFLAYTNACRHWTQPLENTERFDLRGFHVIRDPRDLVVSGYFSSLHSHPTEGWPELIDHRQKLTTLPKDEGLLLELEWERHVIDHIATWHYEQPTVRESSMEALFTDQYGVFLDLFTHLGLVDSDDAAALVARGLTPDNPAAQKAGPRPGTISADALVHIAHQHSFAVKTRRKPGQENVKSHLRKGKAGDWVNHFDPRHIAWFDEQFPGLVARLGY